MLGKTRRLTSKSSGNALQSQQRQAGICVSLRGLGDLTEDGIIPRVDSEQGWGAAGWGQGGCGGGSAGSALTRPGSRGARCLDVSYREGAHLRPTGSLTRTPPAGLILPAHPDILHLL